MSDPPTLFDPPPAVNAAKHDGIDRAGEHADRDWSTVALDVVRLLAGTRDTFTSDDVWEYLSTTHPDASTHEPRALGAVFRTAVRLGMIRKHGTQRPSRLRRQHGRDLTVWTSTQERIDL